MSYVISDECICCAACQDECPESAITEGDNKFIIDPEKCVECNKCAEVCPVGAPAKE